MPFQSSAAPLPVPSISLPTVAIVAGDQNSEEERNWPPPVSECAADYRSYYRPSGAISSVVVLVVLVLAEAISKSNKRKQSDE